MTLPAPASLTSFNLTPLYVPACQIWWSWVLRKWRYQFLYQFLHDYFRKNWTHFLDPPYWKIFKIRSTDLQFRNPGYGWQKNNKRRTQAIANNKALVQNLKFFLFYMNKLNPAILKIKLLSNICKFCCCNRILPLFYCIANGKVFFFHEIVFKLMKVRNNILE